MTIAQRSPFSFFTSSEISRNCPHLFVVCCDKMAPKQSKEVPLKDGYSPKASPKAKSQPTPPVAETMSDEHFITPPKFNIAPEKLPSQKVSSLPTIHFQGLC